MSAPLPAPLAQALDEDLDFFTGEHCEWKLEIEDSADYIEKETGCRVLVFANNGFGDSLFLKIDDAGLANEGIFEFNHEGSEVLVVPESLEVLLGFEDREPSTDDYPQAIYESGEPIQLGDRVQFKLWLEFWKGWLDGVVAYVPGISKKNLEHETEDLKWISIDYGSESFGPVVDPDTGIVKKVRLVERAKK
ncbi:MAG: hypothetical protein AAFX93_07995 [Verrucomicrobiota bacterium]